MKRTLSEVATALEANGRKVTGQLRAQTSVVVTLTVSLTRDGIHTGDDIIEELRGCLLAHRDVSRVQVHARSIATTGGGEVTVERAP